MSLRELLETPEENDAIESFSGKYAFLSNMTLCVVVFEGVTYRSVEHAYVAAKTLDPEIRKQVNEIKSPYKAKQFGKTIALRPDWEDVKLGLMERFVDMKFLDPELAKQLLATGNCPLIEGNYWGDTYWGVCRGVGENNLGKILMKIRAAISQRVQRARLQYQDQP